MGGAECARAFPVPPLPTCATPPLPPIHQYEYPDRYEAEDAAPVGDDSNLLAQPEVLPGPGRLAGYTPGDGRSSFASPT